MSSTSNQPPFQERPANLHQRVTSSPNDEDFDPLVETLGDCKRLYAKLEVGKGCCVLVVGPEQMARLKSVSVSV